MSSTGTSRRQFLKNASLGAGALALPTIVPAGVFGKNAPSNRVTLAALGTGGRGTSNISAHFLSMPDVQVVAACDCFKSRRDHLAAKVNNKYKGKVCKAYADFRNVLARDDVDGVVISTPDHWHVPLAFYAAKAGKDMYVEKPLGVAMAWAWKLREAVESNKVVFQYGTQQRGSLGMFRRGCEIVRNGYIGEVRRVEAWCPDMSSQLGGAKVKPYGSTAPAPVPKGFDYDVWLGPAPKRPYTIDRCTAFGGYHIRDYALGFIAGWGAHVLDIAQWGLDMDHSGPISYEGTGKVPPAGSLWDTTESWDIHCKYPNGIPMRFMGHRAAEPVVRKYHYHWNGHGTTFFCEDGWVSVERGGCYMKVKGKRANAYTLKLKPDHKKLYQTKSQARNFVDCIKSRKPTINPLESAIRSDTISHLSEICIRTGRPIKWDPEKERILGDAEAAKMLDRPMRAPWKL